MLNIVLYRPEKPGNVGNVMRTCAAIGAKLHVIGPVTFMRHDKDLARAAMDYETLVPVKYYEGLAAFIKDENPQLTYYVTRYGQHLYADVDFSVIIGDFYVMFGAESEGIPLEILREHKEKTLRIPMKPAARSLNLANAVAIVAYEIMRQQGFPNLAVFEVLKGPDYL